MPLEIINCALRYAKGARIGGLSEKSTAAQDAVVEYRKALRWLIGKSEWNCQTVTVCPDELPDPECCDIPQGYRHAFLYPDDAVRIASICYKSDSDCPPSELPDVHYRVVKLKGADRARKAIVVDCKPILLEYVCLPSDCDVEDMPQDMRDALTFRMAESLFLVNGDDQNAEKYRQLAEKSLREAKETNARQQNRHDELSSGPLVDARQW